jgi:hypothetical protein
MATKPGTTKAGEVRDIPFLKNDMKDYPSTMDKPLDTADAPGKADSEMVGDNEVLNQPALPLAG